MSQLNLYGAVNAQMSANVRQFLDATSGDIDARVNTMGGSVVEGFAIFNMLRNSGRKIAMTIEGAAASIGSLFLATASRVIAHRNAQIMVHRPSVAVSGHAEDLASRSSWLTSLSSNMLDALASRSTKTREEISSAITAETWFSAEDAKSWGLVDEIIDTPAIPLACSEVSFDVPQAAAHLVQPAIVPKEVQMADQAPKADTISVETIKQYTEAFGDANGLKWAIAARPLAECYQDSAKLAAEAHAASLAEVKANADAALAAMKAENERLADEVAQLKAAVAVANTGEKEPVAVAKVDAKADAVDPFEASIKFA